MYGRCGSWWRSGMATPFMGGGFPWGRGGRWGRFFGPGEIRLALLSMLESGPKHGYELMKELETKSGGIYKASAGAIYPALQQLEDEELVTSDAAAGKRTYSLTSAGKAELKREAESVKKIWQRAEELLRALLSLYLDKSSPHPLGPGADVRSVFLVDPGVAVIDLNSAFANSHRSGVLVEELSVASLIHTISANTQGIVKVKILVDGQERETLAGHADLSSFYDVTAVNQLATQLQSSP